MSATKGAVAVLGPGGVGGLVGGLLARAGHRVIFLARAETAAVLRENGLTVRSRRYGDFAVTVAAETELREPVDACLITVKETALDAALTRLPPDALGDGLVVPLLNGVDHMTSLRERYPAPQVAAGTIRVESTRVAPGVVEHASPFAAIELAGRTERGDLLDRLAEVLSGAGLDVTVRDDETALLWDKLSFLASLALLTTHSGAPAGAVRTSGREQMLTVIAEIVAVARAAGGTAEPDAVVAAFDRVHEGLKSSMLRDAEAGQPIELDAIGGAVLRAADRHGIAVPVTAGLVADLRAREQRRREEKRRTAGSVIGQGGG